jgi:lysophospholipase L1-like esterase
MRPHPARTAARPLFAFRVALAWLALLVLVAAFASPALATLPAPILHLTFDQGTLADSSPAARAVTGSATFQTIDGRKVATLNGTSQSFTVPLLRSFPDGITLAFWTYAQDGTDGLPKNTALGWARQGGSDGTVIAPGWNNTAKRLFRLGRGNSINDEIATPEVTGYLSTWVHWAIVKNPGSGTIAIYRDGQLFSSATGKTIVPEFVQDSNTGGSTGGFRVGRFYNDYYKGHLDDYRIYDSPLAADDIQTIYQQGAATAPTAFNVAISGTASVGQTLAGSYQFAGATEGASTYRWYRAATAAGERSAIPGATALAYTAADDDDGRYLVLGVTPVAADGATGEEAFSAPFLIGAFIDRSLANTLRRLAHDKQLKVVFFGGSITDGAGQNNGLPWRTRVENWFTATYPEVAFTFTNASISGTSSEFGVFRTDRHVLSAAPDLVFVEFAVNDLEQLSDTRTRHTLEGIVRKIRAARPACDIVFVYTTTRANAVTYYESGQLPPRTLVHQQLATHYGIPAIDVAAALVAHKQQAGYPYRIEFGQPGAFDPAANHYLPDHVHPSNLGHQVYGDTVTGALAAYLAIPAPTGLVSHPMPALLGGYDMTSARILDHTHPGFSSGDGGGWSVQALGIGAGGRTENFLVTSTASTASPLGLAFSGRELGVYYRRSTTGGQIAWSVDGAAATTFPFWHETLTSFTSFAMLSTSLGEGNHSATFTPQAYQTHQNLAIAGWLVLGEFTPPATFAAWAADRFSHLEGGASHPDAAPAADPDGDGLPNLLEYALGLDPLTPAAQPPLEPSLTPLLPHSLTLTFLRARPELTYEVLASSDLATWDVIDTNPGQVSDTAPVTVTDSVSINPRRFLRLRVTQ